jgi:putative hydrolase of HD superfamily
MTDERLARQIAFIIEIDKLKTVLRRTFLMDATRAETTAEHSWHLGVMALLLTEYADEPVDPLRVVTLVLVHDIVEIDAGDTYAYDETGYLDKAEREERAAARLYGLLPAEQGAELLALWREFEARETPDAKFANALDRLQPFLHNYTLGGDNWREHQVTPAMIRKRVAPIADISTRLADYVERLIVQSIEAGYTG